MSRGNEVTILWVPAHSGTADNEEADRLAKEAAKGRAVEVPDEIRWEVSLSYLSRRAAERESRDAAQWVSTHVSPERRYRPQGGTGLQRKLPHRAYKSLAGRHYQPLSGDAAIGFFLHGRITGPQRLELDECWWRNCGKRQTRHHRFTECRPWTP